MHGILTCTRFTATRVFPHSNGDFSRDKRLFCCLRLRNVRFAVVDWPRLADWLGAGLDTSIVESLRLYDAGTWTTSGSIGKRLLVLILDVGIVIVGVIGPLALPALIALLMFARW